MKNFFVSILVLFAFFLHIGTVGAASPDLEIRSDHVAGKLEKLGEKLSLVFKFGNVKKVEYHQFLVEKRLSELYYVVETGQIDSIEETASRYSTYVGNLTNFVVGKRVSEKKEDLSRMLERHAQIIDKIQTNFEFESGWWLALQHAEEATQIYSEKMQAI